MEITFFGTGLNMLVLNATNAPRSAFISIDGGAEGADINPLASSILVGRNYSPNGVIQATSGLTLGIHTARIRFDNSKALPSFMKFL